MTENKNSVEYRLDDIWLDSERLDRYYTRSSEHNMWWHRFWLFVLLSFALLAGGGEIASEIFDENSEQISSIISLTCFLVIAIASVVMLIWDFAHKAGVYKVIGEQCRDIARECIQIRYRLTSEQLEFIEQRIAEFEIPHHQCHKGRDKDRRQPQRTMF